MIEKRWDKGVGVLRLCRVFKRYILTSQAPTAISEDGHS